MNRYFFSYFCVSLLLIATQSAQAEEYYTLDPAHTSVTFAVNHAGLSFTYGSFGQVSGRFVIDKLRPENSRFAVAIDASSINTNNEKRDQHLKSKDFFDVQRFPQITFQSSRVSKTDKGYELVGDMTMHGVKREITIPLSVLGEGNGQDGKKRTGFGAQFKIRRSEFGMSFMLGPVGDEIFIQMSFEGIQQ